MTRTYPTNEHPSRIGDRNRVVRQATTNDLPEIVDIHQKAFSHFFLTRLGSKFLRNYYGLVLEYRAGIIVVSEGPRALEGFACGFVDPAEFYRLDVAFQADLRAAGAFRVGSPPFPRHQSPLRRSPHSNAAVGVTRALL